MSAPRFHFPARLGSEDVGRELDVDEATSRHIAQALRMRVGDRLTLFTGDGGEFAATILRIAKRGVGVRIESFDAVERESHHRVTLVQSLIAVDMMDLVVRKSTELGVAEIVPVIADRSQRSPDTRSAKRIARWRQIAVAACEQCGRNRIPAIAAIVPLSDWIESVDEGSAAVMLAPTASASLPALARARFPHTLAIGPEGGFTDAECDRAQRNGIALAHFGRRILRAETAALAALAAIEAIDDVSATAT